jgi:hypothetical protein
MISQAVRDVSTIISVLPVRVSEQKPLIPSTYIIAAVKDPMNDVEVLMVDRGSFSVYIDESRPALQIPEPSDVIAAAICRDFKISSSHFSPSQAEPGLTWTRGGYTKEEAKTASEVQPLITEARRLQNEWFKRLVATADDDWARHRLRKMVSDLQRLACKHLNLERPWDIELEIGAAIRMTQCKFCRADVHPEAVICMHCRGILNMERYKVEFVSAE